MGAKAICEIPKNQRVRARCRLPFVHAGVPQDVGDQVLQVGRGIQAAHHCCSYSRYRLSELSVQLPRRQEDTLLTVEAPGYQTRNLLVSMSESSQLTVTLKKADAAARPPVGARRRRTQPRPPRRRSVKSVMWLKGIPR